MNTKPEYVCPECGGSEFELVVTQLVNVEFLADNDHNITDGPRGDTEWGDDTHAVCCGCHWSGTLGDAKDTQ